MKSLLRTAISQPAPQDASDFSTHLAPCSFSSGFWRAKPSRLQISPRRFDSLGLLKDFFQPISAKIFAGLSRFLISFTMLFSQFDRGANFFHGSGKRRLSGIASARSDDVPHSFVSSAFPNRLAFDDFVVFHMLFSFGVRQALRPSN